jgi:hypothetical protein
MLATCTKGIVDTVEKIVGFMIDKMLNVFWLDRVRCGILECYSTFSTQLRCCMYSRKGLRVY